MYPSLFIYSKGSTSLYVLVYVDDIIITSSSSSMVQDLTQKLNIKFALKELGNLDYFLGVEVKHLSSGDLLLTLYLGFFFFPKPICLNLKGFHLL